MKSASGTRMAPIKRGICARVTQPTVKVVKEKHTVGPILSSRMPGPGAAKNMRNDAKEPIHAMSNSV